MFFTFSLEHSTSSHHYIKVDTLRKTDQRSDAQFDEEIETSQFIQLDLDGSDYELVDSNFPEALEDLLHTEFAQWLDYWFKRL